jgi:hypothetical protein
MNDTPEKNANFEMNVVRFRPRDATAFPDKRARDAATDNIATDNIYELLDLSRYELPDHSPNDSDSRQDGSDDFNYRMRVNIAALIILVALVGLAVADVLKLEQAQIMYPAEKAPVLSDRS